MRFDSRESLRATAFLWTTLWEAPRISAGCAALNAACASLLLPEAIASSTFFISVRMRETRARLTAVRRAVWRAAFCAEEVFAMGGDLPEKCLGKARFIAPAGVPVNPRGRADSALLRPPQRFWKFALRFS